MKLLKQDLLPAVNLLSGIARARNGIPTLCCFRMEASGGRLAIRAMDFTQDATCLVPCSGDIPATLVNARHFSELTKSAAESVSVTLGDGRVNISSDWDATLPILKADEYPAKAVNKSVAQGVVPGDLAKAIASVVWACEPESGDRYVLKGVHVQLSEKAITCEGVDGRMAGRYSVNAISGKCDFILPATVAKTFCWALNQPKAKLLVSDKAAFVEHESGEYSAKLIDGDFPSTARMFEGGCREIGQINVAATIGHLNRCLSVCEEAWVNATIMFDGDGCFIASNPTKTVTAYEATVPGKFLEASFSVDPVRLVKLLESFDVETVTLKANDIGQMIFSAGDYQAVLQPLTPPKNQPRE